MNEGRPLLEVRDLRAGFGANTVLHGLTYTVHEGEFASILGLNGAGKSVSLKVVGGVVPAWSGTITLDGADITSMGAEQRVQHGLAHVPQGRQVFPELTIEQNLRLGAYTLRRRERGLYDARLASVLERFPRLGERREQAAGTLSGGEQAMLAVGRALMSDPKLILVDEATAGLAPRVIEGLFEILRDVNRSGVTILMVEQNVTFALRISDQVHIMQRGQIVYDGEVEALDRDRVAALLGVGRLLGSHVEAAASARSAVGETPQRTKKAARRTTRKATPKKATPKKAAASKKTATSKKAATSKETGTPRKKAAAPKKKATPKKKAAPKKGAKTSRTSGGRAR